MTDWVKCTDIEERTLYVNLAPARCVVWNDKMNCSLIAYSATNEDVLRVRERPEAILSAREPTSAT